MNTCDVEEGTTVAVFGLGAVGLAAVQVRGGGGVAMLRLWGGGVLICYLPRHLTVDQASPSRRGGGSLPDFS